MKTRAIYILLFSLLGSTCLWAQSAIIRVKGAEDLRKIVPAKDQYFYPEFKTGSVLFYNGPTVDSKLNYNLLLREMQFINGKGDTLNLANLYTIKQINIGTDQFMYNKEVGFMEVVPTDSKDIKFATHYMLIQLGNDKMGAYNQSSGTSSITTVKSFMDPNGRVQNLDIKGDILLTKKENYFLVDKNNTFYPAIKSNLLKLFPDNKKAINTYIKERKPNFQNKEELQELLKFSQNSNPQ